MDDNNWGYVESKYRKQQVSTDWSSPSLRKCPACKNKCSCAAASCPSCGHAFRSSKSQGLAVVLALFLGGFGVHKFYLEQPIRGILYLLFSWTFIPAILALIEGLMIAFMSPSRFMAKYG